jgi:MFS family permease
VGKSVGVAKWLPCLMFCWGAFTIAHAYITNDGMFYAFRLMIGVFEAGYYPCSVFFLSTCYVR